MSGVHDVVSIVRKTVTRQYAFHRLIATNCPITYMNFQPTNIPHHLMKGIIILCFYNWKLACRALEEKNKKEKYVFFIVISFFIWIKTN
jgi:hypothetical protein